MDLKTVNNEYEQLKKDYSDVQKDLEATAKRLDVLSEDNIIWKGKQIEAKRNGDAALEQQAKDELEKIFEEVKKIKEEIDTKKANLVEISGKINERVEEIKKEPGMQEHLDEVLGKKYARKLSKLETEKEELVAKKDRAEELEQLIAKHPALENNLKGIIVAQKQIKDLNKELEDMKYDTGTGLIAYKDPVRAQEIQTTLLPDAQAKLATNKTPLMQYITKNKINITEKDIDELAESAKFNNKGELDLVTTMNARMGSLNRNIRGHEKSISDYESALMKVTPNKNKVNRPSQTQGQGGEPLKWYQFRKRFNQWREERKRKGLPSPEPEKNKQGNEFKNSLKYKIVEDIVAEQIDTDLREAKKERKEGR